MPMSTRDTLLGHVFDPDLKPPPETVFYENSYRKATLCLGSGVKNIGRRMSSFSLPSAPLWAVTS